MAHIIHTKNVNGREDSKNLLNGLRRVKSKFSQKDEIIDNRKILSTYIAEVVRHHGKEVEKYF